MKSGFPPQPLPASLTVGAQLRLGLGAIVLCAWALGALAWMQINNVWSQTEGLYNHPFQVRLALGDLQADALRMHRATSNILLRDGDANIELELQDLEVLKADALRQLGVLGDRYLGPPSDVVAARESFLRWDATREHTVRLAREGKTPLAASRVQHGSLWESQFDALTASLGVIDGFARNRARTFFDEADSRHQALEIQMGVAMGFIVLLSLLVFFLLLRKIQRPLAAITEAMTRYGHGTRSARCGYASGDEFATVASAFNELADTLQGESLHKEQTQELGAVMLAELESGVFQRRLTKALMQLTGSQLGAIYLLNSQTSTYEHLESIGMTAAARTAFPVNELEGEMGLALASGRVQHIADIPPKSRFTFTAVAGDFSPKAILTIPLRAGRETQAIISLASLHGYAPSTVQWVGEVQEALATWMKGMVANRAILALNERLSQQNRELEAQTGELGQQNAELEQQKRLLDEASRLKSTFLSNMSHELRTPLNSVIALSALLGRRLANTIPEDERGYLTVIERNGKFLLSTVNSLLDLGRIEAGREELTLERFSMGELAAELLAMLEVQAREKQLVLTLSAPDSLPLVTSDRLKCRHILQNLLANAVKFTESGRVDISVTAVDQSMRIDVTDTGIGIPEQHLGLIFDEFRQADESTSRKYGGSGLGLAIAKKYSALLKGSLTVQSRPGQGSTFTLVLPTTLAGAESLRLGSPVASYPALAPHHGQGKRLLLVEDSEPAILQMTDILGEQGYQLEVARNGREALERLDGQILPDAVILDLMMPEVDGFSVLKSMRDTERTLRIPVLILTAKHISKEELRFLKGNHVHQLVQKGDVGRDQLLSAVASMVATPRSGSPAGCPGGEAS